MYIKNGNRCGCDVTSVFQTRVITIEKGHAKYVTKVAIYIELTGRVCGNPLLDLGYIASLHD